MLEFLNEHLSPASVEILIHHIAGALLHTSVLRSKPKMLWVVGKHDTYKSLIIEILKLIVFTESWSEVSPIALGDRFGQGMIANKIINMIQEVDPLGVKNPTILKNAITKENGKYGKKGVAGQLYTTRFLDI